MQNNTIQYDTIRYGTIRYGTIRYGTIRYGTVRYDTIRYGTIRYDTVWYGTIRYDTVRYGTIRYDTVRYDTLRFISAIQGHGPKIQIQLCILNMTRHTHKTNYLRLNLNLICLEICSFGYFVFKRFLTKWTFYTRLYLHSCLMKLS